MSLRTEPAIHGMNGGLFLYKGLRIGRKDGVFTNWTGHSWDEW